MKVDLQGVKSRLEQELQRLDQRKAKVREQITQIEATQRIVSELAESELQQGIQPEDSEGSSNSEGRAWFKGH
jgi:hypothetical protein